jgi:hypothetical protein
LITRIHRELKILNSQKINDPVKKWENELNRAFLKKDVQVAKKHMRNTHQPWPQRKCKSKPH